MCVTVQVTGSVTQDLGGSTSLVVTWLKIPELFLCVLLQRLLKRKDIFIIRKWQETMLDKVNKE